MPDDPLDPVLAWIAHAEGPWPYLALALGGASEYLLPVLPGDTITLFGAFLTVTAGRSPLLVYAAINAGSMAGAMTAYGFGRLVAARPGWLERRSQGTRDAIAFATSRFARHGAVWLAANRFLPAVRAVFFLAAGLVRMPAWRVLLFGGVSALAWNALILGAAWAVGDNWALLRGLFARYAAVSSAVVVVVAVVTVWRLLRRRRAEAVALREMSEQAPPLPPAG